MKSSSPTLSVQRLSAGLIGKENVGSVAANAFFIVSNIDILRQRPFCLCSSFSPPRKHAYLSAVRAPSGC
jgi:hypothetical protein